MTARKETGRRIADVLLGDVYEVVISGQVCHVEILNRSASGVWLGLNKTSNRECYVTLRDLGEKVSSEPTEPVTPAPLLSASMSIRQCWIDKLRAAAGDKDDE